MTEFKVTQRLEGTILSLTFEGNIDEDAAFPKVDTGRVQKILIDLNGIHAINSVGIREWLDWIRPLAEQIEVILARCPKSIVFQFNMVDGFLPKRARVASFYVPYFCDKCGYEGSHLLSVDKEISRSPREVSIKFDAKSAAKCTKADCEIEMDVTESKYFQFLKRE